jgi:1,4-dihydroxy-2-naphthoyl-CoA synthase
MSGFIAGSDITVAVDNAREGLTAFVEKRKPQFRGI